MPPFREDQFEQRRLEREALLAQLAQPSATTNPNTTSTPPASPNGGRVDAPGLVAPETPDPNTYEREPQTGGAPPSDSTPTEPATEPTTEPTPNEPAPKDPAPSGPYQSETKDGKGYLMEATRAYQSTLQGISDEAKREAAVESYLRSLIPELEARGMKVGDVRKEKMQINGQWVDLYRDITNGSGTGAAEAQWLVDDGGAAVPRSGGTAVSPTVAVPGTAVPRDNFYAQQQARLRALMGQDDLTREELLRLMGARTPRTRQAGGQ